MKDTDMVIMWKNGDGSATLSQRRGMGYSEPLPVMYPARRARITEPKITAVSERILAGQEAWLIELILISL